MADWDDGMTEEVEGGSVADEDTGRREDLWI